MSRKWRQSNIALISLIYHHLTPKLVDDYLMTTDPEAEAADALRHEEHICTLITAFHTHHFPDVVHAHHPAAAWDRDTRLGLGRGSAVARLDATIGGTRVVASWRR
ncbi:hypothetical protein AMAG_02615 [Allomyces macrogynus ATCC 38327]|uniref:Far11/STRP C-terminal domain-containing protein n=1 Tax=Allomyces macrogynus (strain ATCC 38327) TaxID=578462 RepID=A0A0L0S2N6_ALLM3|nr:hypothetical protein AMAG_02615 [Allomyces macrogynus ATCC 38327]|eukprot:KNE56842.1 hypothetical protein AMAG_02615 [Allomyces macrogynus ATCC 38327]